MSEAHTPSSRNYVKIWAILLALLVVSVLGPMFEIQIVTLITAFGIAVVKAYMVAKHFMHIDHAARYVSYLIVTCLVFMLLFFAGSGSRRDEDPTASNWVKPGWHEVDIDRDLRELEGHH